MAQASDTLDISSISYEIIHDNAPLDSGQIATFEIHFGDENTPIDALYAFDLILSFTDAAFLPESEIADYSSSWLADDQNYVATEAENANGATLNFTRTDLQTRSGFGEVVSISLEAIANNTLPEDMIVPVISGQVIVDNLEMKRNLASELDREQKNTIRLYPEPAHETLHLHPERDDLADAMVISLSGQIRQKLRFNGSPPYMFSVENLKPGMWFLLLEYENGDVERKRFRVMH